MYATYGLVVYTYAVFFLIIASFVIFLYAYQIFRKATLTNSKNIRASNILIVILSLVPLVNSLDFVAFHRFKTKP